MQTGYKKQLAGQTMFQIGQDRVIKLNGEIITNTVTGE